MQICVLSAEEAGRIEHWGVWPVCKGHKHISRSAAHKAVADDTHRFVGGADTAIADAGVVTMIVPVNTARIWSPVQCHSEDGKTIMGFRSWGLKPLR